MHIEHIAIWVQDLEKMKAFYLAFFSCTANTKYHNPKTRFSSYFLTFDAGARIELMHRPDVSENLEQVKIGLHHFAISVGSKQGVNELTDKIRSSGYLVTSEPRTTGDNYYESVVLDPEGNAIEITV